MCILAGKKSGRALQSCPCFPSVLRALGPVWLLLAPLCGFSCLPPHMVGHGTVSPTTCCPKATAGPVSSSGTCRCLLPSKCPELHRMRGAPAAGTWGSTCHCAPGQMRWVLVFIALTPMAPRTSPTSLRSGLIHVFSAWFAVSVHTEELEPRNRSPGSRIPTVF